MPGTGVPAARSMPSGDHRTPAPALRPSRAAALRLELERGFMSCIERPKQAAILAATRDRRKTRTARKPPRHHPDA